MHRCFNNTGVCLLFSSGILFVRCGHINFLKNKEFLVTWVPSSFSAVTIDPFLSTIMSCIGSCGVSLFFLESPLLNSTVSPSFAFDGFT